MVKLPASDALNCSRPLYLTMASFSKRLIVDASNNYIMISATDIASEVCNVHKVFNQMQHNVDRLKAKSYLVLLTSHLGCQDLQERKPKGG